MKGKILIIALLLLGIMLSGCVETAPENGSGNTNTDNTGSGSINPFTSVSEEEKFVEFGAELACEQFDYAEALKAIKDDPDQGSKMKVLREENMIAVGLLAEKYGYKEPGAEGLGEVEALTLEYNEDLPYAEAVAAKVKTLCPAAAPELEQNIDIMKSGMSVVVTINEADDSSIIKYKYFEDGFINKGSRDTTANMEDIEDTIREKFGDLADKALEVARYKYE